MSTPHRQPVYTLTPAQHRAQIRIARTGLPHGATHATIASLLDAGLIDATDPVDYSLTRDGVETVAPWGEALPDGADRWTGHLASVPTTTDHDCGVPRA